ncbi:hypothetical protein [Bacillus sp. UMB0728]|uniref:hypothetical protein n=1 Tax=Bacillus sp. UMB0728 TaxID=2066052 RepID=UPI000C781152|nr:hypothetical protein [Bacillus sp. UMB0728]PLR73512.1 hypothetical protein CYJ37_08195 [Bacillus sp. UMB0728]
MEKNNSIINSIINVRHLINNSILMLRDFDAALSKHGFQPLNGNALGTETSKNINQSMSQYSTFFPQYIARQYGLAEEVNAKNVSKILFINIQFFHGDYEVIPPTLINSVMIFPEPIEAVKTYIDNWWLKYTVFEDKGWDKVLKSGELNKDIDEEGIKTLYWCRDLLSINGQKDLLEEAERLINVFLDV